MKNTKLFFATNRNHEGNDQWKPTRYGKEFSADGRENLRFGELEIDYDPPKVQQYLDKEFENGRIGDGEKLSEYFAKQAENTTISAFEDLTSQVEKQLEVEKNSSTRLFKSLKDVMMNAADVVIYIHGYSVSWEDAVGGALALEFMLNSHRSDSEKNIAVVLFSWPSNGSKMPFAAYHSDREDARDSAKALGRAFLKLKDYLAALQTEALKGNEVLCNQEIHLLCHSMGNYLLKNALKNKIIRYSGGHALPKMFKNIFLCAPDVKDDVLESGNEMSQLHEMASKITVYFNDGDLAMEISKYSKHSNERLGHTGSAHPSLVHNKVHQVDCSPLIHGIAEHSYYLWATVNKDIWQSIAGLRFDSEDRHRRRDAQSREWVMT
ncbi:MAG: alpha/beta hydrolase [Bacteroidales bacterium]|nr:alpha/beta hydrolase [Bacteroidales bacterium]